ncbi:hypothetical protein TIFTF001_028904 [Ficus carica]|uniref:Uncharacterized protein n=1 Tax=Ficus carica TaxID=3494 RepID=A0AA88IX90_FICCA|nr:hypothetical protein TIFTF001_028904 [Ficus carica]
MSNPTKPDDHDHNQSPQKTHHDDQQDHDYHDQLEDGKPKMEQLLIPSTLDHHEEQKLDYFNSCKTPTSEDQKIPTTQSCPSTPRKPASDRVFRRKRTLSELHFFESTGREEVESFFRSSTFKFPGQKKRCMSV